MMKRFILGVSALALLAGVAVAQTAQTPPPPPATEQNADAPPPDQGNWWGWGHKRHGGHHGMMGQGEGDSDGGQGGRYGMMGGEGGQGGRHGMMRGGMMQGKGFGLMLGNGQGLRINCGDEPMKQCVEAAQPLIDALNKANPDQTPAVAPKTP